MLQAIPQVKFSLPTVCSPVSIAFLQIIQNASFSTDYREYLCNSALQSRLIDTDSYSPLSMSHSYFLLHLKPFSGTEQIQMSDYQIRFDFLGHTWLKEQQCLFK